MANRTARNAKRTKKGYKPSGLLEQLDEAFLVNHPKELLEFWEHAKSIDPEAPRDAFTELYALELVGPFIYLETEEKEKDKHIKHKDHYLVVSRFSTDLPEMQTLMVYRGGRFCYWRDVPEEEPGYLIHVPNEPKNFPQFTIVGDKSPFWALAFLMNKPSNSKYCQKHLAHFLPKALDLFDQKFIQELRSQRKKTSFGEPFHGMGLKVEVNAEGVGYAVVVGYRPVTDNIKRLRMNMAKLDKSVENTKGWWDLYVEFYKLYVSVLHAYNAGMKLEFGHDLFVSNYDCFQGMEMAMLCEAYEHLKLKNFAKILAKHWKHGRRVNDKDLKSYK